MKQTREGTKEHTSAVKALKKANNALTSANWKLELYKVGLKLKKKNSEQTQRALLDRKKVLEAKLKPKDKKEK